MTPIVWEELDRTAQAALLLRSSGDDSAVREKVRAMIAAVRLRGDAAVREFAERFDGVAPQDWDVPRREWDAALATTPTAIVTALRTAAANIARFHAEQRPHSYEIETAPGIVCGRRVMPFDTVAAYVPGGSAPLPSSLLMTVIPAVLAGCRETIVLTPPQRGGGAPPVILAAAAIAGASRVLTIGGAHAIAAAAFGTLTVPRADKICGPGNSWVTAAKLEVAQLAGGPAIDLPAGPSEVMVLGDGTVPPHFTAWDLLAQAEHGPDSQVLLVTTSRAEGLAVAREVLSLIKRLPREKIARQALASSRIIVCADRACALAIANRYAPEHLILAVDTPEQWLPDVRHAGSIFLGAWSPESVGDYASGTNHVLPTAGSARAYSGLGLESFVRYQTYQRLTRSGLATLAPVVTTLAAAEGLDAHRMAVVARLAEERA